MIDLYNYSNLEGLLDGLTDLNRIPKEYSAVLEPYFQNIARNAHLKSRALKFVVLISINGTKKVRRQSIRKL